MSFFRYPGGKSKLKDEIAFYLKQISQSHELEYREPFFGGGSIGLQLLHSDSNLKLMWINDIDPGISCLWTSVICFPDFLKKQVENFKPSVDAFYQFKKELTDRPPEFISDKLSKKNM